jgi:hypothetical protein
MGRKGEEGGDRDRLGQWTKRKIKYVVKIELAFTKCLKKNLKLKCCNLSIIKVK